MSESLDQLRQRLNRLKSDPDPAAIVQFLEAQFELIRELTAEVNRLTKKVGP
jgi:hypothetical protein